VAFGEHNCDYARLQEIYHEPRQDAARYSPCECVPAVAAGLATERWTIEHVVRLLDGA
jgi:hypothetical protein